MTLESADKNGNDDDDEEELFLELQIYRPCAPSSVSRLACVVTILTIDVDANAFMRQVKWYKAKKGEINLICRANVKYK